MQREKVVARPATEEDIHKIVDDYGENESSPLNPFSSVSRLKRLPRDGLLVAELGEVYAGFLYWFLATERLTDGTAEKYAHIANITVNVEFRKKGVGEALLRQALKDIHKQEISAIYVDAPEANIALRNLYEKIGFNTFARTLHMRFLHPAERNRTRRSHKEARELAVFMVELREQSRMFMVAYSEVKQMISRGPSLDEDGQRIFNAQVWSRIQAALAACSALSKILWPTTFERKDGSDRGVIRRGSEMRHILKLPVRSPFPTAVRNSFEHIDERIMAWLSPQPEDIPWGWSLSPFTKAEEPVDSSRALRYFNMVTMDLRVADTSCNLREVMEQVRDIEVRLPAEAQAVFGKLEDRHPEKSEGKSDKTDSNN